MSVQIQNLLEDREAPVPRILFNTNLGKDGEVLTHSGSLGDLDVSEQAQAVLEVQHPSNAAEPCFLAISISDYRTGDTIGAAAELDLPIVIGPVSDPAPEGLDLLGRFFTGGGVEEAIDFSTPLTP